MARKKFNVVTIAAMIAVLALGSLGLGYAAWTDTLTINGSATSGTLDVQFGSTSAIDGDGIAGPGTCAIVSANADNITFLATNAYPGYTCTIDSSIENHGSLPAELFSVVPDAANPDWDLSASTCIHAPGDVLAPSDSWDCNVVMTLLPTASQTTPSVLSGNVTFTFVVHDGAP